MLVKLTTTCSSSCVYFRSVIFEEVFCKSYSNSFLEIRAVILNSDEQPKPKHKPQLWIDINILIILKQLYKNIYPNFWHNFHLVKFDVFIEKKYMLIVVGLLW